MTQRSNPLALYLKNLPPAEVQWIGVRPGRKAPLISVASVEAVADRGLEGDHRIDKSPGSGRQVTLISKEFIEQIEQHLGQSEIDPARLRRNIVISGLNLNALRWQQFWLGDALLEAAKLCHPCARMEAELGPGGVAAMVGYGGLCARVLRGGRISVGDAVRVHID